MEDLINHSGAPDFARLLGFNALDRRRRRFGRRKTKVLHANGERQFFAPSAKLFCSSQLENDGRKCAKTRTLRCQEKVRHTKELFP